MSFIMREMNEIRRNNFILVTFSILSLTAFFIFIQQKSFHYELTSVSFLLPLFKINLYILPIIAMIAGAFSIYEDISSKTIDILFARFISPMEYIIQKSLSIQLVISVLFVFIYFLIYVIAGIFIATDWLSFLNFLLPIILLTNIFIQIGCLLGTILHERMKLFSVIFAVWFFFEFLYDLILLYLIPVINGSNVHMFTILYFISPIKTVDYYFMIKLGILNSHDIHALFNLLSFEQPLLILLIITVIWIISTFSFSYLSIRRIR